jgi:uncharacterized protein YdhG (YjbR/CyaY superfamily)
MVERSGDRESCFPAIEKKYGLPMSYWFEQMETVAGQKYPEQIAFLREGHGFSQAHANALVMFTRGSTSAKRVHTIDGYLAQFDETKRTTVLAVLKVITAKWPKAEVLIAWNHPLVKINGDYVFGVSVHTKHILLAPFNTDVLAEFGDRLATYEVNKKTFKVPVGWKVDKKLITDLIAATLSS